MTTVAPIKAPFPYFGGKLPVADIVWDRFGTVDCYVEPFFGSGAVLLNAPSERRVELVNDIDGLLCNFWRAIGADPEAVAAHADWPVNECDLHARHAWLVGQRESITERLCGDPDYYDVKAAGWWVWGACAWIGTGWCSGEGPWRVVDGLLVKANAGQGINRKLPHVANAGQGINRQLPHVADAGRGINRQLPHVGNAGQGTQRGEYIRDYFAQLSERLRDVRVACGDWRRVVQPSGTTRHGLTAVFLDPPYGEGAVEYSNGGNRTTVAQDAAQWAIENGGNPLLRIAYCGYEGAVDMPGDWECYEWKAAGGYASGSERGAVNSYRERIWFSPNCIQPDRQLSLLEAMTA